MMNMTRGETFTLEVSLDMDAQALEGLSLRIVQNGRVVLRRELADAVIDTEKRLAVFAFDETETRALRAGDPAFAQARGRLRGGGAVHSGIEEICVIDALCAMEESPWS